MIKKIAIKSMRIELDIKIKLNKMMRDKIKKKSRKGQKNNNKKNGNQIGYKN